MKVGTLYEILERAVIDGCFTISPRRIEIVLNSDSGLPQDPSRGGIPTPLSRQIPYLEMSGFVVSVRYINEKPCYKTGQSALETLEILCASK